MLYRLSIIIIFFYVNFFIKLRPIYEFSFNQLKGASENSFTAEKAEFIFEELCEHYLDLSIKSSRNKVLVFIAF